MPDSKSDIRSNYPLPAFSYRVTVGGVVMSFSQVSGLTVQYEPVTYKHGLSYWSGAMILPGMRQPINITMQRGIINGRDEMGAWFKAANSDTSVANLFDADKNKRDIIVDLVRFEDSDTLMPVVRWTILKALPVKMDAPSFDATSNDVAIESIEFIAHGLQVDYNP